MHRFIVAAVAATFAAPFVTAASAAPHYRLTPLPPLPGGVAVIARSIGDTGKIGGEAGGAGNNRLVRLDGAAALQGALAGAGTTSSRGVNNAGTLAAVVQATGANDRAALVTGASASELAPAAGYAAAGAFAINNGGTAVGYSLVSGSLGILAEGGTPVLSPAAGRQRATVWTAGGVAQLLADPGSGTGNSNAVAINDGGMIAGITRQPRGNARAVRWDSASASATLLPLTAGEIGSGARAINALGDIAGYTLTSVGFQIAAVWRGATPYSLSVGGFDTTQTRGINDTTVIGFGQAYDAATDSFGDVVGLIWRWNGHGYTGGLLDREVANLGAFHTRAPQAINARGQIVGFDVAADGTSQAYLLSPVPEPASWALLGVGFATVAAARRRRGPVTAG